MEANGAVAAAVPAEGIRAPDIVIENIDIRVR